MLSPRKLERIKSQFLGSDWNVTRAQDYGNDEANNPFATFAAIPVKVRYQFLLDDARFHIATFIKGPVCNGSLAAPFARFFPDLAFVLLRRKDGSAQVYSIVHNREHANVSWMMGERLRLAPYQDTLTIRESILGAYPNMFFELDEGQVDAFSTAAASLTSRDRYDRLVERFGASRTSSRFWEIYDEINVVAQRMQPIYSGTIDLSRYELDRR